MLFGGSLLALSITRHGVKNESFPPPSLLVCAVLNLVLQTTKNAHVLTPSFSLSLSLSPSIPVVWISHEFEDQDWDEYSDICTLKIFNRTETPSARCAPPALGCSSEISCPTMCTLSGCLTASYPCVSVSTRSVLSPPCRALCHLATTRSERMEGEGISREIKQGDPCSTPVCVHPDNPNHPVICGSA